MLPKVKIYLYFIVSIIHICGRLERGHMFLNRQNHFLESDSQFIVN